MMREQKKADYQQMLSTVANRTMYGMQFFCSPECTLLAKQPPEVYGGGKRVKNL